METAGLEEALRAVEGELRRVRQVYRATVFLYWAWAMPVVYLLYLAIERLWEWRYTTLVLSLLAVVGFIAEERKAFRRVVQLEGITGDAIRAPKGYIIAQMLVWPISAAVTSLYAENEGVWMLGFIGLGLLLLGGVELIFTGSLSWGTLLAGSIALVSTELYGGTAYAVMVISLAFSLTAYIHIKGAMRE